MAKTTHTGLSRRKMMLVAGGAVAGAGALVAAPFRELMIEPGVDVEEVSPGGVLGLPSLASATYEQWESVVGANFSLGGGTSLQLAGVRALPTSGDLPQGVRNQAFAAFFDPAGGQSVAPDLIYTATHSVYGPTRIFLAGTSDRRTPGRMVAVFN